MILTHLELQVSSPKSGRERADLLLVSQGLASSREKAQALILAGLVSSNGSIVSKAGQLLPMTVLLTIDGGKHPYVGRGGIKLEKALREFAIDPSGVICLDIGAATGGFSDCLLQMGARKIYAVDVGYGQLAWQLRQDERVVNLERRNIRHLDASEIGDPIDLAVCDLSFISLKHVLPRFKEFLQPQGQAVTLIKPQFEAGRGKVNRRGVVTDPQVHIEVLEHLQREAWNAGMKLVALTWSPIKGPKGNIEFLAQWHFLGADRNIDSWDYKRTVVLAHLELQGKRESGY